jgi:hypothetical protein
VQTTEVYIAVFGAHASCELSKIRDSAMVSLQSGLLDRYHSVLKHACGVHNLLAASATAPVRGSSPSQSWPLSEASDSKPNGAHSDFGLSELINTLQASLATSGSLPSSLPTEKLQLQLQALASDAVRYAAKVLRRSSHLLRSRLTGATVFDLCTRLNAVELICGQETGPWAGSADPF